MRPLARLAGALGLGAAAALVLGLATTGAQRQPVPEAVRLPGAWRTYANGDDILSLAQEGPILWAGTRAGGLVRWDTRDGSHIQYLRPQAPLGGNTVYQVVVGTDGRKWLATSGGLTVFNDGGTADPADDVWRTYTAASTYDGLPSNDVRAIGLDGNQVWVGTAQEWDPRAGAWTGGGLALLDTKGTPATSDDTWAPVATFETTIRRAPDGTATLGLVSDNVSDIVVVGSGVWVATAPHRRLERPANPGKPPEWQLIHGGLSFRDTRGTVDPSDDRWYGYSCEAAMQDFQGRPLIACDMTDLVLDDSDRVWAAAGGMGVIVFPSNRGTALGPGFVNRFDRSRGLASGFVHSTAPLGQTAWFGLRDGGVQFLSHKNTLRDTSDDQWQDFTIDAGLARSRVQVVIADAAGAWAGMGPQVGVGGGIQRLAPDGTVTTHLRTAAPHGPAPPSNFVTTVAVGPDTGPLADRVWLAMGSRIQRIMGYGLAELDTAGTPWTDDDEWRHFTVRSTDSDGQPPFDGLAGDNIHALQADDGRLWVGAAQAMWDTASRRYLDGGLSIYDGQDWTRRHSGNTGAQGLKDAGVTTIARGCDGRLWLGTGSRWTDGQGVSVLAPGADPHVLGGDTWEHHAWADLASNETTGILADCTGGAMWVSAIHHNRTGEWSDGGVARLTLGSGLWNRYDITTGMESYSGGRIRAEVTAIGHGPGGAIYAGAYGTRAMSEAELIRDAPYWPVAINMWQQDRWTFQVFDSLGSVSAIATDDLGRAWVAITRGGLARAGLEPESWRDDRLLPGLLLYDGSTWRGLDVWTSGAPAADVSDVTMAPDGSVWVSTEGYGVARYSRHLEEPTPTATTDAPRPTATQTPRVSPTSTAQPTGTGTATRGTNGEATSTPAPGRPLLLPWVQQRRR